jgi:uncharacterized protein
VDSAGSNEHFAVGLISSYWYAPSGRRWPVIVAHAALDFAALFPYVTR